MRKIILLFFTIAAFIQLKAQTLQKTNPDIPTLEEVSGIWVNADTVTMTPSLRNFRAQALLNLDMVSVSWFASAPYSGGYHTGVMRINGKSPRAQLFRWYPWQALRKVSQPTYDMATTTKAIPEKNGIMWEITITNTTNKTQKYAIEQDLIGFISHYSKEQWPWAYPYPTLKGKTNERSDEIVNVVANIGLQKHELKAVTAEPMDANFDSTKVIKAIWPSDEEILNSQKYKIISSGKHRLVIADTETDALVGFSLIDIPTKLTTKNSGGTAYWNVSLKPGANKKIRSFMTWDNKQSEIDNNLENWTNTFDQTFADVEIPWKNRWQQLFQPNNELFSGCFPVLKSNDKKVNKVYYTGPLTLLTLLNTNLPVHKNPILTGGPRWGATVNFFWDATCWSGVMASLDPVGMKKQMKSYISIDPSKYFGIDNYSGKGVGNGYVSNYWALFQLIRSYITITKDYAFLNEYVGDKKVIDHLYNYSYNWKKVSIYGQPGATDDIYKLADFGSDPWNVLECVPSYIHIIPSFNAGYVWMMNETAEFYEFLKQPQKAAQLRNDADEMMGRLMKLYAGNGVWHTLFPDNKKVEVRHILDFMYFGKYLNKYLTDDMKKEMVKFVEEELLTDTWMRALSLKDAAATYSDRPDHGPLGAFDAWPSGTIDALTATGYADKALRLYRSVEPVTYEGCWSQSHELWGENKFNKNARVRIPERGWHNRESEAGIEFSQVLMKSFMGFYPDIKGNMLQPIKDVGFEGILKHVLYGGKYYTLTTSGGTTTIKEE